MDYHLEREVRLSEESEYNTLYSWSLQEFDKDGNMIGSDQIPWKWGLHFTASELRYIRSIQIEQSYNSEEENKSVEDYETITATLHSGICKDGQRLQRDTAFSMFGTGRNIRNFGLWIGKLKEGDNDERCKLWGCVSYTSEIDFRYETTDDTFEISLWLSQKRFNSIAEIIKNQSVDIVQVSLSKVSGIYSDWSPSISTNSVKIFASDDYQKIVYPEKCNITPPRLGEVGEFGLTIIQRCKLNPKQDLRSINIYKHFEEQDEIDAST